MDLFIFWGKCNISGVFSEMRDGDKAINKNYSKNNIMDESFLANCNISFNQWLFHILKSRTCALKEAKNIFGIHTNPALILIKSRGAAILHIYIFL